MVTVWLQWYLLNYLVTADVVVCVVFTADNIQATGTGQTFRLTLDLNAIIADIKAKASTRAATAVILVCLPWLKSHLLTHF